MTDFPTPSDLFRVAECEVLTRNSALTRAVVERDGTDANALTAAGVGVGDELVSQLAQLEADLFLDSAKGPKLDRLVYDLCGGMKRNGASPAITDVYFTTTAPAASGFTIPQNTRVSAGGVTFYTRTQASFPGGSTGPVIVPVQSLLSGLNQAAGKNTITTIVDFPPGGPSDLAITNPLATAGADDVENDERFLARARLFPKTVEKGTLDAIVAAALAVPGVRQARAFEAVTGEGQPARIVDLIVADAFTEQLVDATTLPVAYQLQSAAFVATVQAGLTGRRCAGIYVSVRLGVVVLQGVTLALKFQAGVDTVAAAVAAQAVAVAYTNSLGPGQTFSRDTLNTLLKRVPGLYSTTGDNMVFSPSGDVVPDTLQVIRTTTDLVTTASPL